jgi:rhamnosyltransferase
MQNPRYPHVGVSIVAYQPEAQAFCRLVSALQGCVGLVVIVDNGGTAAAGATLDEGTVVLDPGYNVGVAAGHNMALARIFADGCSHALLFDQDSLPQEDMIGALLNVEQELLAHAYAVGAIGPQHLNGDGRAAGFVRLSGCRAQVSAIADPGVPVPARRCDFLITSGTLIRREVFEHVGPFAESLFIDNVDIEWCYRAASLGYACYGAIEARMQHALGDRSISLPFSRDRSLVVHEPLRIYFITRNRWLLYRMPHIPWGWKLADFPRMAMKIAALCLLVPPRLRYMRAALAGVTDGLKGLGGLARRAF